MKSRIIDVVHAISMWIYLYGVSIVHPGDTLARTGAPELGALVTVFSMELLSSSLVQLFFSHRVYMLSRRLVIAVLGCVRASVKLARLLIIFILLGPQTDAGVLQNPVLVVMPAFAAVAVVEVFNTVTLCVVLRSRRAQIRRTKKVIDKLMLWSIQTGLLISICSILVVLLLVFSPRTEIWAVPFAILPKLFSLSLLSSLNSRAHIRRAMENTPVTFSILDSEPVAGVVPTGPPILLELPNRGRNAADADDAAKFPPQDLENNVGLGQQH